MTQHHRPMTTVGATVPMGAAPEPAVRRDPNPWLILPGLAAVLAGVLMIVQAATHGAADWTRSWPTLFTLVGAAFVVLGGVGLAIRRRSGRGRLRGGDATSVEEPGVPAGPESPAPGAQAPGSTPSI